MLNIDRREHIDLCLQDLKHVLVALRMEALPAVVGDEVGMRQLVDQHHFRPPRQDRIHIHLIEERAFVFDLAARHLLQLRRELRSTRASVGLHYADDDVFATAPAPHCFAQHAEGLADAGRIPQKYLEPSALLPLRGIQPFFRSLHAWGWW